MSPLRALFASWAVACLITPSSAGAGSRGAFDPISTDSHLLNGFEQPALRPVPEEDGVESFFSFTTRSTVVRFESSREIWLHVNASRAGFGLSGSDLEAVRVPLLRDPTGQISYIDPAWSPDGRYLAYATTDRYFSHASLYVQEYVVSDDLAEAAAPIGDPVLVLSGLDGSHNRRPAWSPDGGSLAFESDRAGGGINVYTIQVFPTPAEPVLRTSDPFHAQHSPAFSPDGTRLLYASNVYGPDALFILDLTTPFPHTTAPVETRRAVTTPRRNPGWSSDGTAVYYDTAAEDDPEKVSDVYRVDLATQERCAIYVDASADWDADVSRYEHRTPDGIPFNYFLFASMAVLDNSHIPNIWRAEHIQSCVPPLALGVGIRPNPLRIGGPGQNVVLTLRFPPETKAAGYQCQSFNGPLEGVRMRVSLLPSPTLAGMPANGNPDELEQFGVAVTPDFRDYTYRGDARMDVKWDRASVEDLLVSQGLVNQLVPLQVDAYSNLVGRSFRGYAYVKVIASSLASDLAGEGNGVLETAWLSASPNPFNPSTTLRFRTVEAGDVTVRVFDARGQLVRTLLRQWLPGGEHETRWDGRDEGGAGVASGLYFAQLTTAHGSPQTLKLMVMK